MAILRASESVVRYVSNEEDASYVETVVINDTDEDIEVNGVSIHISDGELTTV